jgi:hypothetical protein
MSKLKVSEHQLQKLILDWLKLHRIFHIRSNVGAMNIGKRFIKFGTLGQPDIICVIKGRFVGIEVKSLAGIQSRHQFEFEKSLEAAGGLYILARSLEDVVESLASLK